jgi:hypothetical protein
MYNNSWKKFYISEKYANIYCTDNKLLLSTAGNGLISYNQDLTEEFATKIYAFNADYDKYNNTYWIASEGYGTKEIDLQYNVNTYNVSGPALSDAQTLKYSGERMYIMNGRGSKTDRGYKTPYISYYQDNKWTAISPTKLGIYDFIDYAYDVTSVITDPNDKNHYYLLDQNNPEEPKFCFEDENELVEIDDKELIAKLIPLFIEASKEEIDL